MREACGELEPWVGDMSDLERCDYCRADTPTGKCPECGKAVCDYCARCEPCICGDPPSEDGLVA